jgi:hypothetical protein
MWTASVWNMALGSPPARSPSANWTRLDRLIDERSVDVALLNEAPVRDLAKRAAIYSDKGTVGWDLRRDNGKPKQRPWSAAVVTTHGTPANVNARAKGSSGRRPNVAFGPSKPGTWAAGMVRAKGIGSITCVSLYGFMDELSDASVHRSLSDISPIFTDPKYREYVLIGGDLNASTQWERDEFRRRDANLLARLEAFGLVDCLAKMRTKPLEGCTCNLGRKCTHSWTRFDAKHAKLQVDYLFASEALAARLTTCEALHPPDWAKYSDHSPIIATFE